MHGFYAAGFRFKGALSDMSKSTKRVRKFMLCTGQVLKIDELINFPNSHIIGEIRLIGMFNQKRKFTSLALYEVSLPVKDVPESLPEIRGDVIGDMLHIKCTLCRHRRQWQSTRATLLQRMSLFEIQPTSGI